MNLLLLRPSEVAANETVVDGRRAAHVLGLLAKRPGDQVRVGVLGEGTCAATLCEVDAAAGRVRLTLGERAAQSPPRTSLVLAVPRPKALSRIVQLAASFGVRRLDFVGAHKVDPAYFSSPRLAPERLVEDAELGLEQGGLVHPPIFAIHRSLGAYLRTEPAGVPGQPGRLVFHPGAGRDLADPFLCSAVSGLDADSEVTLAFGPDGGFVPSEIELLESAGFRPTTLSSSILRTEVAVAAGLGQLELMRRLTVPMAGWS